MTVFIKKVSARDSRWHGRVNGMMFSDNPDFLFTDAPPQELIINSMPDTEVICNGCNCNIYDENDKDAWGWLVYFDYEALQADEPYDVYCDSCVKQMFDGATEVG